MKHTFASYLYDKKFSEHTIKVYLLKVDRFTVWSRSQRYNPKNISYRKLLEYVKHLKSKNYQPHSMNGELIAIRQYFNYLMVENYRGDNPAEGLYIKGEQKKVLYNLLSNDELENLYYSYPTRHKNRFVQASLQRDKVIVGLMIYQGITREELFKLQL